MLNLLYILNTFVILGTISFLLIGKIKNGWKNCWLDISHLNCAIFRTQNLIYSPQTSPDAWIKVVLDCVISSKSDIFYLPSMSFEIYVHLFPCFLWASNKVYYYSFDQGLLLTSGAKWLCHLNIICKCTFIYIVFHFCQKA